MAFGGLQPSDVQNPVPAEAQEDLIAKFLQETPAQTPQGQAGQAAPQGPELPVESQAAGVGATGAQGDEDLIAQFLPQAGEVPPPSAPTEEPIIENEPGFIKANIDQFDNFLLRVGTGLIKDPEQKVTALKKRLGEGNVRVDKDGEILFRKEGQKVFKRFDPDEFEVFMDIFGDTLREQIEGTFGTTAVVGGTAATGGLGAVAGPATFAAGATAGSLFADMLAENTFGVDTTQSEGALAGGAERLVKGATEGLAFASINKVGEKAFAKAKDLLRPLTDRIRIRALESKQLREAVSEIPVEERTATSARQTLETALELEQKGFVTNLPGTNIPATADQLLPASKQAQTIAKESGLDKTLIEAQEAAAKQFSDAVIDVAETAAKISKGGVQKALERGRPGIRASLPTKVENLLDASIKREGAVIGEFRKKAGDLAKTTEVPTGQTGKALAEIADVLGLQPGQELPLTKEVVDEMVTKLGVASTAAARSFIRDFNKLNTTVGAREGVGLPIDKLIGLTKEFGSKNTGARRIGGVFKLAVGKFSSALRSDLREGMGIVLNDADKKAYEGAISQFRLLAGARDDLGKALGGEMTSSAFVKNIINKKGNVLQTMRAAKAFLGAENPVLWDKIKGQFLEEAFVASSVPGRVLDYSVASAEKKIFNMPPEVLREIFPGAERALLRRTFSVAKRLEKSIENGTDGAVIKNSGELAATIRRSFSPFTNARLNALAGFFSMTTKNGRMLKLMRREGVESFLKEMKEGPQKSAMRETFGAIMRIGVREGLVLGRGATIPARSIAPGAAAGALTEVVGPEQ